MHREPGSMATAQNIKITGRATSGTALAADTTLARPGENQGELSEFASKAPEMAALVTAMVQLARSTATVLIEGETGVGKELVARAIHRIGPRASKPFIVVDCGALPAHLVESILFGHEKGAFTGAIQRHAGKFREAQGGTLLLDEIGELPLDMQARLLRVLQGFEIDPVGARRPERVDVRILAATNRNLEDMARNGQFREDLFYRLNIFPLRVPPLRARRADIPALMRHFAARFAALEGFGPAPPVLPSALSLLARHDWPGNVRQLEHAVHRAILLSDGAPLAAAHFPGLAGCKTGPQTKTGQAGPPAPPARRPGTPANDALAAQAVPGAAQAVPGRPPFSGPDADAAAQAGAAPPGRVPIIDETGEIRPLAAIEADILEAALSHCDHCMSKTARRLGLGRSTLYRRMRQPARQGSAKRSADRPVRARQNV